MNRLHRRIRRGLSLMEVILAIAILGGALAVIGELIRIGARNAATARDLTTAQLYCESKLAELSAGIEDPTAGGEGTLDEFGEWQYTVTSEPLDIEGLLAVTVTVQQSPDVISRPVSFSLTRWIIDPAVVEAAEAADAAAEAARQEAEAANTETAAAGPETNTDSGSGSNQGSSGNQGGQGQGGTGNQGGNNPGGGGPMIPPGFGTDPNSQPPTTGGGRGR